MGWLKDWREDMKKTWLFKSAKSIGRTGAKGIQYTAVPIGTILFGPLGGLAAMPLAAAAGQVGPTKNAGAQLKRDAISGAAIVAGSGALNLVAGQSFTNPLYSTFSSLFGWGANPPTPTAAKPMSDADLYKAYFPGPGGTIQTPAATGGFNPLDLANKLMGGTQANPANLEEQYKAQLDLARKYQEAGDITGAVQAAALAEHYRQQLVAQQQAQGGPAGTIPVGFILLAAGAAAWLLLRRKK